MKGDKPLIRKTFSQERFEVLIKKQKAGEASFRDLIELDEIVNRVADIRHTILEEMEGKETSEGDTPQEPIQHQPIPHVSFIEKVKLFFDRLLRFNTTALPVA
jgi:hypothetical protein